MSSFKCDLCLSLFNEQFTFFEHLKVHYGLGEAITTTVIDSVEDSLTSTNTDPTPSTTITDNGFLDQSCSEKTTSIPATSPSPAVVVQNDPSPESISPSTELLSTEHRQSSTSYLTSSNDTTAASNSEIISNRIASIIEKIANAKSSSCLSTNSRQEQFQQNDIYSSKKVQYICPGCSRIFKREKKFSAHISNCCSSKDLTDIDNNLTPICVTSAGGDDGRLEVAEGVEDIVLYETGEEFITSTDENIPNLINSEVTNEIIQKINKQLLANLHTCIICDATFSSKIKLDVHLRKIHPEISRPSKKKRPSAGLRKQEVLKCPECERVFNHRNSLVYHMRSHTGERPHQCESCGKSFFATSALKVHMRLHTGDKPFKCENCGRHFRQWGDLKYHVISIHSNIRSYQCEFCGKDFARKYSLIVHRRIHTGERNYKCEYCGKCFRAASYLQNHRRIHTGEKPHQCVICAKPFRVRSDMKRHMASHSRDHSHQNNRNAQSVQSTNDDSLESNNVPNVITLNGFPPNQIVTIGSQQLSLRDGDTIQVMLSDGRITVDQSQQLEIDVNHEGTIAGELGEETPMITLTSADAVTSVQSNELPDGVMYSSRDGTVETVAIRENNTGTLYVWPVFMN